MKKILFLFLLCFVIFTTISLSPVIKYFPILLNGKTNLIILTNESELRPCGGFATAFGIFRGFPYKLEIKNIYQFKSLSSSPHKKLVNITNTENFWDLGVSSDLQICAEKFRTVYNSSLFSPDQKADRVILIDFLTIEKIFKILKITHINKQSFSAENFFATISRSIANTDRHDEKTLLDRKTILGDIAKNLVFSSIFSPLKWRALSQEIAQNIQKGNIYIENLSRQYNSSQNFSRQKNAFGVQEWNLGGGKSSRYLQKFLDLDFRETSPGNWKIREKLTVKHLGGLDEPLSQKWQGGFEFIFPSDLNTPPQYITTQINPGEIFTEEITLHKTGNFREINLFVSRGDMLYANITVSAFPQAQIKSKEMNCHENICQFVKKITSGHHRFNFDITKDSSSPFVIYHEWIDKNSLPKDLKSLWQNEFLRSDKILSLAEIHFSEQVIINSLSSAEIIDKNFAKKNITDHPEFYDLQILPDQRSAVVAFWQKFSQPRERFHLQFSGITDLALNAISSKKYTIINK